MQLQFIGADRTVTGSMHLIRINNKQILLDCGLYQGRRKEAFEINRKFELFDPAEIDCLILSHAHIDHSGNIPTLVKKGFKGQIYCTPATRDLAEIMLKDSAHIQERDIEFVNKKRKRQGKNLFEPLYTIADASQALNQFTPVHYHEEKEILPGVSIKFFDAGHILGSAITFLTLSENGRTIRLGYTGDLGRPDLPILKDPEKIPDVDYLISESTYGGRFHDSTDGIEQKLAAVVKKAVERQGKIIVPAFSIERTQEIVYEFHKIFEDNVAPRIPIYVDSPLSTNATAIFRKHPECFDAEAYTYMTHHDDPFGFNRLIYITDVEDSKKLNDEKGPLMIISASGMAETGRILHHLLNNIENEKNIIMIVGYCAENTLGRKIIEREPVVKIFGEECRLKAEVVMMNSLSGHADSNELTSYISHFDKTKMKNLFIVHGDFDQQLKLNARLNEIGFCKTTIPQKGDVFEI